MYNIIGMNEWVKRYIWEFPHKHNVFTAPDEHMPYTIQLHIMSMQPANKAAEQREREILSNTGQENNTAQPTNR